MQPGTDEQYMARAIELAQLGGGLVAPNPMVGAVLVHKDRIIGEGWHRIYGEAHAEVNCIASVAAADRSLISGSTMYVTLEPCAHFGKTPPCAQLLIREQVKRVVVGVTDPFARVNGKGIADMEQAGISVTTGMLENECREINRRFFTFHQQQRPYIILKWAQTADGYVGSGTEKRLLISNELTNRLVHKWRSEEAAIMVGTNTAIHDDPVLTTRLWPGKSPLRVVIDMQLRIPKTARLFNDDAPTIVVNAEREGVDGLRTYMKLDEGDTMLHSFLNRLYASDINSVMIEGGAALINSFIEKGLWDEARIVTNKTLTTGEGLPAPVLRNNQLLQSDQIGSDLIEYYKRIA